MDTNDSNLTLVRDILTREVETINFYQRLLDQAQGPDVEQFLKHIIEEEKEHVAEAINLIKQYDPRQASLLESADHWREPGLEVTATQRISKLDSPSPSIKIGLTVGSLRQKA